MHTNQQVWVTVHTNLIQIAYLMILPKYTGYLDFCIQSKLRELWSTISLNWTKHPKIKRYLVQGSHGKLKTQFHDFPWSTI